MAYTIIEVERMINIPSRKIRFWLDKGLFPFVERNENGVRYFAKSDMEWLKWIDWLRQRGMILNEIRAYAEALSRGIKTAPKRRALLQKSYANLQTHIASLQEISQKLETKLRMYDEMIEKGVDTFNPQSMDYKKCERGVIIDFSINSFLYLNMLQQLNAFLRISIAYFIQTLKLQS